MEKKKTIILEEGEHTYDYVTYADKNKGIEYHELWRSNSTAWSEHVREKLIIGIENDGNGIKFYDRMTMRMDYARVFEMKILLDIYALNTSLGPSIEYGSVTQL